MRRGSLTFVRYFVQGRPPRDLRQKYVQAVRLRGFTPLKPEDEAMEASGWCALGSPYDLEIDAGKLFDDSYLTVGFRVDRWRVPSALLNAQLAEEEQKILSKTGRKRLARKEKQELKQRLVLRLRRKVTPVSKAFDVCWDLDGGTVLFFTHSVRQGDAFAALFEKTFGLALVPDSPYVAAQRAELPAPLSRALAAVEPTRLVSPRTAASRKGAKKGEVDEPDAARKRAPRDEPPPSSDDLAMVDRIETTRFLGGEFLLWLWLRNELVPEKISLAGLGDVEVWLDTELVLRSPIDPGERVVVRGMSPPDSGEAREAVRAQKLPVRARVVVRSDKKDFSFALVAERFAVGSGAVPAVLGSEPAEAFLERMELVGELNGALDQLYATFLAVRLSPQWSEAWEPAIAAWLDGGEVPAALLAKVRGAPRSTARSKRSRRG